jgi:hypothetical protein
VQLNDLSVTPVFDDWYGPEAVQHANLSISVKFFSDKGFDWWQAHHSASFSIAFSSSGTIMAIAATECGLSHPHGVLAHEHGPVWCCRSGRCLFSDDFISDFADGTANNNNSQYYSIVPWCFGLRCSCNLFVWRTMFGIPLRSLPHSSSGWTYNHKIYIVVLVVPSKWTQSGHFHEKMRLTSVGILW